MSDVTTELAKEANDKAVEIVRLQAENAKLRDGANAMRQLYEDELKHALADNAKLRELVRELLPCYQWSDCYSGCMAADGPLCPHPAKLTERARELGVEVVE